MRKKAKVQNLFGQLLFKPFWMVTLSFHSSVCPDVMINEGLLSLIMWSKQLLGIMIATATTEWTRVKIYIKLHKQIHIGFRQHCRLSICGYFDEQACLIGIYIQIYCISYTTITTRAKRRALSFFDPGPLGVPAKKHGRLGTWERLVMNWMNVVKRLMINWWHRI